MACIKARRGDERTIGPSKASNASKASIKQRRVPEIGSGKGDEGVGVGDDRVRVHGAEEHAQISDTKALQNLKVVAILPHNLDADSTLAS
jgi:hypothetical protein